MSNSNTFSVGKNSERVFIIDLFLIWTHRVSELIKLSTEAED